MSNPLNELERRLLRLQGSGGSTNLETSTLQQRLRNLQEPEKLQTHTLESLQHKFSSIFGQPEVRTMPTPSTTTAVDIYLAAVREQDDWQDDEWNFSSSSSSKVIMAQQAFLGSNVGIDSNDVSMLLAQAHDAVRLSAQPIGATYNRNNNDYDEDDQEDEDDEVAAIIQASKEEVLLDNKYGNLVVSTGVETEEHRQKKKEHKKNTKKKKKKKKKKKERKKKKHQSKKSRKKQFSSSSDSASSEYTSSDSTSSDSSQNSSVSSDSSSHSDNDNHSGRRKRKRNKAKSTTDTTEDRDVVNSFKQEEADTLNRLREAVRNEGRDSDLVRLLAQKLVQLRKLEKKRLHDEVTSLKFKNKLGPRPK